MWRFFDKRATIVYITDTEFIDLFHDGLYHHRTFQDFSRRRPSSITKLKDVITSWDDERTRQTPSTTLLAARASTTRVAATRTRTTTIGTKGLQQQQLLGS
jgi:hypothetical protein